MSTTRTHAQRALDRTIRSMMQHRRKREREMMSPAEIDERLIAAIVESVTARGTVTEQDLRRTNVPAEAIEARFAHCLAVARERAPQIARIPSFA